MPLGAFCVLYGGACMVSAIRCVFNTYTWIFAIYSILLVVFPPLGAVILIGLLVVASIMWLAKTIVMSMGIFLIYAIISFICPPLGIVLSIIGIVMKFIHLPQILLNCCIVVLTVAISGCVGGICCLFIDDFSMMYVVLRIILAIVHFVMLSYMFYSIQLSAESNGEDAIMGIIKVFQAPIALIAILLPFINLLDDYFDFDFSLENPFANNDSYYIVENPNMHHVEPHWRHYSDGSKTWVDGDGDSTVNTYKGWKQHNPNYRIKK